jgi:Protein of unknown function (DUF3562)
VRSVAGSVSALVGPGASEFVRATPKLASPTSGAIDAELTAVEGLSDELHVPVNEVREIYRQQLQRLAAGARIRSFLGVLATRNTRSVLRGGRKEERLG